MNVLKMQSINNKISDTIMDAIAHLEEDRFYPSVREAGTAPTDSAVKKVETIIIELIKELMATDMNYNDIGRDASFEEIVSTINSVQDENISEEIEGLERIDRFVMDNGESKYRYVNTVYEHKPSKRFIRVVEQCGVGEWVDITSSVDASETVKKEIVKYEWS